MISRMLGGFGRIIIMKRIVILMVMAGSLPVFYIVDEIKRISIWRPATLQRQRLQWHDHQYEKANKTAHEVYIQKMSTKYSMHDDSKLAPKVS